MGQKRNWMILIILLASSGLMFMVPFGFVYGAILSLFAVLMGITIYFNTQPPFRTMTQDLLTQWGYLTH
jgi:hypothetical protein